MGDAYFRKHFRVHKNERKTVKFSSRGLLTYAEYTGLAGDQGIFLGTSTPVQGILFKLSKTGYTLQIFYKKATVLTL